MAKRKSPTSKREVDRSDKVAELQRHLSKLQRENEQLRRDKKQMEREKRNLALENEMLRREMNMLSPHQSALDQRLMQAFNLILREWRSLFCQDRTFERAWSFAHSFLLNLGRNTITGALCTLGQQFRDWSGAYKFFSQAIYNDEALFNVLIRRCLKYNNSAPFFAVALDDSVMRKRGKRIPGVQVLRDPLSKPYHVNLITGIRFIQASALLSPQGQPGPARGIPIAFRNAPSVKKPKRNAKQEEWAAFREAKKSCSLGAQAAACVRDLRQKLDSMPEDQEKLPLMCVDASMANEAFLDNLPQNTNFLARVRKDVALFAPASDDQGRRFYGERLPTPEQILKDPSFPLKTAQIYGAGKVHTMRFKVVGPVLWKRPTKRRPLRLIVVEGLRYRRTENSELQYRAPAYLLTSDLQSDLWCILQAGVNRWEIEVNIRDEKSLLGVAEPQVWNPASVERVPAFIVAAYGALLLAGLEAFGSERTVDFLPQPKWRNGSSLRPSANDLRAQLRRETWAASLQGGSRRANTNTETPFWPVTPLQGALYACG